MSLVQQPSTTPLYLPHLHSLCLRSGILIKSADFDSQQLNAHKNTHAELAIGLFPSATPPQNVYLSSDSTHCVRQATVAPFQQQHSVCVCVYAYLCVHAGIRG